MPILKPGVPSWVHPGEVVFAIGCGDESGDFRLSSFERRQTLEPTDDDRRRFVHHVNKKLAFWEKQEMQRNEFQRGINYREKG